LAIVGWEWIAVVAVIVMFLIWGPDKIPKVARALGQARREFEVASRQVTGAVTETRPVSSDDILLSTARDLGIETVGKTREEISAEIVAKGQQGSSASGVTSPPQEGQTPHVDQSEQAETTN